MNGGRVIARRQTMLSLDDLNDLASFWFDQDRLLAYDDVVIFRLDLRNVESVYLDGSGSVEPTVICTPAGGSIGVAFCVMTYSRWPSVLLV